jgi:membrane protease YdiL (CAAX protease family)
MDARRVEATLFARESKRTFVTIGLIVFVVIALTALRAPQGIPVIATGAAVQVLFLLTLLPPQLAAAMVKRDLDARTLLASLPITPSQTLEGKVAALRRRLLPVAVPIVLVIVGLAVSHGGVWGPLVVERAIAYLVGLWLLCDAAVPVAFLVGGTAAPLAVGGGATLTRILLMFPFVSAVATRSLLTTVVSLAMLAAVGAEARRSAERCVRWLDDSDDVARERGIWRALLALSAFFAVQALAGQMLAMIGRSMTGGASAAFAYCAAAVVLALMTHREKSLRARLRLWPARRIWLLVGAFAGGASAAAALAIAALAGRLGWAAPASPMQGQNLWTLALCLVVVAPLAEEYFFRGWLQTAIADELPAARAWRAIVYAALAFAAVHAGTLYVPQLLLGLAAGALYFRTRALLPGMIVHAVHNGLVTLVAIIVA